MQILSDIHHLSYLLIKKHHKVVILIPPKLYRVISQDFVDRTATNLYDAFLQCVFANHHRKATYSIVCQQESSVHPLLQIL